MAVQMQISTNEAKEVVLGLVKALNDESFQVARRYLNDDVKHVGPFGSRDGGDAYIQHVERFRLKFDIQKIFADGKDVCALYDATMSGVTVFACGWFQVEAGKIISQRTTFDPRPLLALSKPN
jgi:limonene-1,2-epoxide hydrolase